MDSLENGLYQNDIAMDVREQIEAALNDGQPPRSVMEEMTDIGFQEYNNWERAVAWLALADTLMSRGYVSGELRKKAQEQIEWFEQCGYEKNDMLGDALRELKERLDKVPPQADEEATGAFVLDADDVMMDEEEIIPQSTGPFEWVRRLKEGIGALGSGKKQTP